MVNASDVVPVLDSPLFKKNENITLVDSSGDKIIIGIKDSSKAHEIPDNVAGFEVVKVNFPRMKAVSCASCSPTCDPKRIVKTRPIIGGISVGHYNVTAGTIGCIVYDPSNKAYILSNNHVLANTSTMQHPNAKVGDAVYSPGKADGGVPGDTVATLSKWIPLDEENSNYVDAAIAEIKTTYHDGWLGNNPGSVIYPNGSFNEVAVGDTCYKYGRTTGYTENVVVSTTASISVEYSSSVTMNFQNQIVFITNPAYGNPICGGDSGAGLLDKKWRLIGLCFAGGEDDNGVEIGVANFIYNALQNLGVNVPFWTTGYPECDPGTMKCDSGKIYTCSSDGKSWTGGQFLDKCSGIVEPNTMDETLKSLVAILPFAFVLGIIMSGKNKKTG
jgi:hypothetical protein